MDDTSIGNSQNKEETNGRPTGIAKATVKDSNATDEPVGMVGKILVLEEQDRRERERAADVQPQPAQCGSVHTTIEGPNSSLYDSESHNAMGMVGKRLILAQEEADAANAAAIVTSTVDRARARAIAPAGAGASAASVLQVSGTNQNTRRAIDVSPAKNSQITPTEPPQLTRQDNVQQQVLPGAVAVPGVGERQFGSSTGNNISDPEEQDFVRDNHHDDNHNLGLVEAETVDDLELPNAIAVPAIDSTSTRRSITQKYQFRFAAFAITLLLIGGIIIGSICGAGLCKADDSIQPAMTERDMLQAPKIKAVLAEILGDGYFDRAEESGDDLDVDLSQFLMETRLKAFDWIVNHDPMQLEYDAPNLVQRFVLVLFYYQTTRHKPWKECNPVATNQKSSTTNFCYQIHSVTGDITVRIWGDQWLSDSHECKWAGISCDETVQSEERTVDELRLDWNHLNGPLPWEITRLPLLRSLWLHNNMLTGKLPTGLFFKKAGAALETLLLSSNQISSTIPAEWVANLLEGNGKLVGLYLRRNTLTGKIPSELGLLSLKNLILTSNTLTGPIPQELFKQSSLQGLNLGKNDLTGTLPSEVGLLTNLQYLYLNYNNILGSLPSEIGLSNQLEELILSNTNIQGTIPEELFTGGLKNLGYLYLDGCNFTGTISQSLGLLTNLKKLRVSDNHFHGTIPNEVEALPLLTELLVNGNDLSGTVPVSFCQNLYAGEIGSKVVADCLPNAVTGVPGIQCASDCCTSCCDETGVCLST
ncbi:LRR receptor-like serine threonine-protein kinase [Seminavis robusta]|uniref:LRR receptor-like serine threonine-protein kinase n=1 Tax=Seminavis robusta TaxID=568900 RepID=A0A9N8D9X0_9STRA|nr:LRR receptor-like serine threonine-protein kinase [Seminavis robusta]|eukprot:Sro7_g005950.1 LRR receptor-like serine threonine-protein kinase (760) ;mRNA; f:99420-101862